MEQLKNVTQPIYGILKTEHALVKKLFDQILSSQDWSDTIWKQIDSNLATHMDGEEKYFYPRLTDAPETSSLAKEALREHTEAKKVQATVASAWGAERFARCRQLSEMINHHVWEEENQLFPQAQKVLSTSDAMVIAGQFEKNKLAKMVH